MMNEIMRLAFSNSATWKQINLTGTQRKVLNLCSHAPLTASELSNITGRSINHASLVLRKLHDKGYLTREAVKRGQDGVVLYYIYKLDQDMWGE